MAIDQHISLKLISSGKFDIITHREFREMVDALRNSTYKARTKGKKNCSN